MKTPVPVVITAVACLILGSYALADNHGGNGPTFAPVDFRACNLNEGMTWKDLDRVAAKFRDYTNKNDFDYAAWTLFPELETTVDYDFGWLGSWTDSESYGVSTEHWKTNGREIYAEMAKVMDCTLQHQLAMSVPISAPEGTPQNGVIMFYPCMLEEDKNFLDAYEAHMNLGQAMKGMGSLNVSWLFQPALGGGTVDYYHVVGFSRYSDMGATMELYANGGGYQAFGKYLGGVTSCGRATVFDAVSVRDRDER